MDLYNPDQVDCASESDCDKVFFSADGANRFHSDDVPDDKFDVDGADAAKQASVLQSCAK